MQKYKKVFIQTEVKYPRYGAQANYVENLAKAIMHSGYDVIIISGINEEYLNPTNELGYKGAKIKPIIPSKDEERNREQRKHGYCQERMNAMMECNISKEDIVITFQIGYNQFYHEALLELRNKINFKVIVGVLELYGREDYTIQERYDKFIYAIEVLYPQYDAILSISDNIDNYYKKFDMKIYKFPPMVDWQECSDVSKDMQKIRFVVPASKDSLGNMLKSFAKLEDDILARIELHTCSVSREEIYSLLSDYEWNRLQKVITIHDWLKYEELVELYKQMHFLLIARKECQRTLANFPSKVPECMGFGIVPIVSEVGDYTRYYLRNGQDSIFMNGDSIDEIVKAIRVGLALSDDGYYRLQDNVRETVKIRFDYRIWAKKVKEMLERV